MAGQSANLMATVIVSYLLSLEMKRVLIMAVGLLLSLPISAVAAGSAMAATGQAAAGVQPAGTACSANRTPIGNYTIKYYSAELTDPYKGGDGTAVKFDTNIMDTSDWWTVNYIGTVGQNGFEPFTASGGNNFELVNVYATNHEGVSNSALCLEFLGSGVQAGYLGCRGAGQPMNIGLV
jgi:hypothetical protein